ncbi:hypothetical protein [Parasitella parasitica]|uniref:FAD dependent oxidoreductase domain-containing protein n=1 Tax=Parasitella parasitica TaxID=35722 RepID=A0A0B7NIY5_9FUNG|nr:hypothetical protein [Parasitella parasitica]
MDITLPIQTNLRTFGLKQARLTAKLYLGWCNSSESIKHLYPACVHNGVNFVLGSEAGQFKEMIVDYDNVVSGIVIADRTQYCADRVILATGAWTPSAIDMHGQAIATGQYAIHFKLSN